MSEPDQTPVDSAYHEQLLAAARAAAAWGRAHQAGWTGDVPPADSVELPTPAAAPPVEPVPLVSVSEAVQDPETVAEDGDTVAPTPEPSSPLWPRLRPWLLVAAVLAGAAALTVALIIGARDGVHIWQRHEAQAQAQAQAQAEAQAVAASAQPPNPRESAEAHSAPVRPVGRLSVTTTPTGARVSVDGHPYGTTPLLVDALAAGPHTVVISSRQGIVRRTVRIDSNQTTELSEAIIAGWVRILCPFPITVSENGQPLWLYDDTVKLSAGTHHLRFENQQMNYASEQDVVVNPGGQTTVSIVPPPTS